jgi:hypothetical protein
LFIWYRYGLYRKKFISRKLKMLVPGKMKIYRIDPLILAKNNLLLNSDHEL